MRTLYGSMRRYKVNPANDDKVIQNVPIISKLSKFRSYDSMGTGDGTIISFSLFRDKASAEESNNWALKWTKSYPDLFPGTLEMCYGGRSSIKSTSWESATYVLMNLWPRQTLRMTNGAYGRWNIHTATCMHSHAPTITKRRHSGFCVYSSGLTAGSFTLLISKASALSMQVGQMPHGFSPPW